MPDETRQVEIIHLSDIHFGKYHRFDPPPTPGGDTPSREGYPTMLEKLEADLDDKDPECPVILCVTGDLATEGSFGELKESEEFVRKLAESKIYGKVRGLGSIFLVPGNHDVQFASDDVGERWHLWIEMHNRLFGTSLKREDPWQLASVHNRADDLGVIVVCLNSAIYVQKGKPDQDRGHVDMKQLGNIKNALETIPEKKLKSAIRIALIHHHPSLIPALAEPGRGYDAVHNSGKLLTVLRQFGFHLMLHGHKHNPFIFTDDTHSPFWTNTHQPLLVAAGGSLGSTGLPALPKSCNCYNQISVKWHPAAGQTRIVAHTRGLSVFDKNATEEIPERWRWDTLGYQDKVFYAGQRFPLSRTPRYSKYDASRFGADNEVRKQEYAKTRGNMAVVEVMPSLIPGQAYEARLWISRHRPENQTEKDIPVEVTWMAGDWFPTKTVRREQDPHFCASFNYWGPMLVQAQIKFPDGTTTLTHIYARMPQDFDVS